MANLLEERLKALGCATERRKATAGAGADIVIGTLAGTGRRKVMLQAHMDTVYPPGVLQSQPYKLDGNRLYGPGIADDKGGIAVILHALAILRDAGWKDYAQITVLFNPDEEVGSVGSGEAIAALADQHDVVLSFEPNGAKAVARSESLLLGAAGTATAVMEVKGRAAHAGAAPELGRNAIVELAHQVLQTRDIAKDIPGAQLNWTNVISNKASNQIPDLATARADVRITVPAPSGSSTRPCRRRSRPAGSCPIPRPASSSSSAARRSSPAPRARRWPSARRPSTASSTANCCWCR
jgi:glutamate carboxypeptidase